MKMKLKIIKESRYQGLYDVAGIQPGSLDLFIKHFVNIEIDVEKARRDFFVSTFGKSSLFKIVTSQRLLQEAMALLWTRLKLLYVQALRIGTIRFLDRI